MRLLFVLLAAGHVAAQGSSTLPTETPTAPNTPSDPVVPTPSISIVDPPVSIPPTDTPVESSSPVSSAPSSSSSTAPDSPDDDEFSVVSDTDVGNGVTADITPPPDVPTLDQHLEEQAANMPTETFDPETARSVAELESGYFVHFVETAPAPGDKQPLAIPDSASNCMAKRKRALNELMGPYDGVSGPVLQARQGAECNWIDEITIPIHFHFIRSAYKKAQPYEAKGMARLTEQMTYLNRVYNPLGIYFRAEGKGYTIWDPPKSGKNSNWTQLGKSEDRLVRWQTISNPRPRTDRLVVWVVNDLKGMDVLKTLNGYAYLASSAKKVGSIDGVLMRQGVMFGKGSTTLIHEIGHWLGLNHPFGKVVDSKDDDCKLGDGLLKTSHLSGLRSVVNTCSQVRCDGKTEDVYNWMSYSTCRGTEIDLGFTTDQKTAMFVRYMKFRKGFKAGDCVPRDPKRNDVAKKAAVNKRSAMQDLVDGKCPDIDAQVSIFLSQPTAAPSEDAAVSGYGGVSVVGFVGTLAIIVAAMLL
ncbi:hypothetical protein QBC34DRAFT_463116 [Podospora aff. communis PSN243]|uniref:Peptidase M43 pregnancy-associated plasma-A domain-containing protein n=1 Tax=Podospora aff. communis PSN243 TaxID=3040156 RepID=A0AAV9GSU1_9PEZI|nr:hypothetical protein QBC34DRAFT_463116 [Podospora aff. communis PSN243]